MDNLMVISLWVFFFSLSPRGFFPHYSRTARLKINLSDIMCVLVLPSESSRSALVTSTYINSRQTGSPNSSQDWERGWWVGIEELQELSLSGKKKRCIDMFWSDLLQRAMSHHRWTPVYQENHQQSHSLPVKVSKLEDRPTHTETHTHSPNRAF